MRRNFGLSPRVLPRKLAPGANAGASFFTWKAAAKGVYDRFCKRDRASAQRVSVHVFCRGVVLFDHHGTNTYQTNAGTFHTKRGV
jgi:hypothetical protein